MNTKMMTNTMTEELHEKWYHGIKDFCVDAWKTEAVFIAWAESNGYEPGDTLRRSKRGLPWGPGNAMVIKKPPCDDEWALRWNKTVNRLRRHWGLELFPEG